MRLISHRGNINGIDKKTENTPHQIVTCIETFKFDVEIDVWNINGELFLGHDAPIVKTNIDFLYTYSSFLWIHCKNIEALFSITGVLNKFFHNTDDCTLTSRGFIWTYPGKPLTKDSICVKPETVTYSDEELQRCAGICSDEIARYEKLIRKKV